MMQMYIFIGDINLYSLGKLIFDYLLYCEVLFFLFEMYKYIIEKL